VERDKHPFRRAGVRQDREPWEAELRPRLAAT
jgi:hypothetical protein